MSKEEGMEEQDNIFVTLKDHLVNRGLDRPPSHRLRSCWTTSTSIPSTPSS